MRFKIIEMENRFAKAIVVDSDNPADVGKIVEVYDGGNFFEEESSGCEGFADQMESNWHVVAVQCP